MLWGEHYHFYYRCIDCTYLQTTHEYTEMCKQKGETFWTAKVRANTMDLIDYVHESDIVCL